MTRTDKTAERYIERFEPAAERGPIKPFDFDPSRYVFISYLTDTDPDLLRAIVRCLLRRGVGIWMYKPGRCRLDDKEIRGVRSQSQEELARPGILWPQIALDAMDKAGSVLLLLGPDSPKHQKFEIDHAINTRKGAFHVVQTDGISDEHVPAALQRKTNIKLKLATTPSDVIAGEVKQLADNIGREVFGAAFKPPRSRSALQRTIESRRGAIATIAAAVAVGAFATFGQGGSAASPPVVTKSAAVVDGPRLALVITQRAYNSDTISRVEKAEEEGKLVGDALTHIGFNVTYAPDNSRQQLIDVLEKFRTDLKAAGPKAVAFVYYTGHGIQHPDEPDNYLLGTDTALTSVDDIRKFGVNLTEQRDLLHTTGARAVFLVFDACRNIPRDLKNTSQPAGYQPKTKGLRVVKPTFGMLVAYATKDGEFAEEGIYAPILAEELRVPNQIIEQAFVNSKYRVASKTGNNQLPYNESEIYEGLCFNCAPPE